MPIQGNQPAASAPVEQRREELTLRIQALERQPAKLLRSCWACSAAPSRRWPGPSASAPDPCPSRRPGPGLRGARPALVSGGLALVASGALGRWLPGGAARRLLLLEAMPRGHPLTLSLAFSCFGAALLIAPRLARPAPPGDPGPVA